MHEPQPQSSTATAQWEGVEIVCGRWDGLKLEVPAPAQPKIIMDSEGLDSVAGYPHQSFSQPVALVRIAPGKYEEAAR